MAGFQRETAGFSIKTVGFRSISAGFPFKMAGFLTISAGLLPIDGYEPSIMFRLLASNLSVHAFSV
ncbi:hypothetical protein [Rossellomorea vietnamensis]|uniref:hypothetical protein n=1 Tax=Rossellomorea vietnamensis TaxID=218284 RepID=UPI001E4B7B63|nr:hypothetical protein [Rossellomorea vietnamensis]MCC5800385.1 hypothetical protein [Rossellomorea vietnamensis]